MGTISNTTMADYQEWPLIGLRTCFYMLHPRETFFGKLEEVPPFAARAIPPGMIIVLIELLFLFATGRRNEWRLHSAIVSFTSTAMYEGFSTFFLRGLELTMYEWVFNNHRLITLPWNGFTTFFVSLIAVEFCGYWWHRMSHELAIMWASHELHHSSDDYNLSVAFRNSSAMRFFRWTFYIPLAVFGVPTAIMITHLILGSIYNGFVHQNPVPKLSKVIPGIGHALEYIFVTPSHHRVHHASNKYCIDKNYGQYMIIWDRMFGTFVEEREDEQLVFGSLTQPQTYDMAKLQVSSYVKLWQKFNSMNNFADKMKALFYGPGWFPGTPRLGDPADIPDVRGRKKYSPTYPTLLSCYLVVNSFCVFYSYLNMASRVSVVSAYVQFFNLVYIFFGYTAIGGLYDRQRYAPGLELLRVIVYIGLSNVFPMLSATPVATFITYAHYVNLLVWPFLAKYIYNYISVEGCQVPDKGKASNGITNGYVKKKESSKRIIANSKSKQN